MRAFRKIAITGVVACMAVLCGCDWIDRLPQDGGRRARSLNEAVSISGTVGRAGKDATIRHNAFMAAIPAGSDFDYSFDTEKQEFLQSARKLPLAVYAGCGAMLVLGVAVGFLSHSSFGIRLGATIGGGGVLSFGVFWSALCYPWVAVGLVVVGMLVPVAYFVWKHDPASTAA